MIVLANLRKRVAAVDLTRRRGDDQNANDVSQQPNGAETTENRTTLSKVSKHNLKLIRLIIDVIKILEIKDKTFKSSFI